MSDFLSAGRLEDHPFADLSGHIFQGSRTGELILESGNQRRTVWFLGGNPVAVDSRDPQDHLAQFLLEHGKISADDAHRLAELPETREALASADFLPKETLNWGVKSRFVNLCYDLFRWENGDYSFHDEDPPRELFLLKVPAHSLIFKGVGFLGQAAVIDAVPDDAVCGSGPVAPADASYLGPDAHRLLDLCRPGLTVAEVLDARSDDRDQARRMLFALACLGLISLSRGRAAAPATVPEPDEGPEIDLDNANEIDLVPPPAPPEPRRENDSAGISLEGQHENGEFGLNLPPLNADFGSLPGSVSESAAGGAVQPLGSYPFQDESGPGSFEPFGTFPDTSLDHQDVPPAPADGGQAAAGSRHAGRRVHLPRIAGIALGGLAAAGIIAFAGWWWLSGSEPPPPPVKPPVRRPAPAVAPKAPVAAVVPASSPATASPSPVASAPSSPAAAAPPSAAPVPGVRAPAPRPAAGAPGASGSDRYRTALEIFRAGDLDGAATIWESLLVEEHRGAFTLQILTACQHDTVRDVQRSLAPQELYLVTKKVAGRVCFRICIGTFESRETAGRALAGLPGEYRNAGAAVRAVADVLDRDR